MQLHSWLPTQPQLRPIKWYKKYPIQILNFKYDWTVLLPHRAINQHQSIVKLWMQTFSFKILAIQLNKFSKSNKITTICAIKKRCRLDFLCWGELLIISGAFTLQKFDFMISRRYPGFILGRGFFQLSLHMTLSANSTLAVNSAYLWD